MTKQRLFDENDNYNKLGDRVARDIHNALTEVMKYYAGEKQISVRDLAHVICREVQALESIIHMGFPGSSKE